VPRSTRRSKPSKQPDDHDGAKKAREARGIEVWRGALAAAGETGQRQLPPPDPRQRQQQLRSQNDIAGLDVFGENPLQPSGPVQSVPSARPRNPAYPPPAARGGPAPLALGSGSGSQPATAVAVAPAAPPREPTLTSQLRSVAPPDVARQATHELGVLSGALEVLPARLEESGLAHIHQRGYRGAALAYAGLAERAWEAVAEERLEQSGAEEDYRAHAIDIARQITRMQHESRLATENADFHLSRRRPLLWRRRVRLVRTGLATWMATVSTPADPLTMGQGLFQLRGYVGLANASAFELALFGALLAGVNAASFLLAVGLVLLQIPTILADKTSLAVALAIGALLVAVVWLVALVLTVAGRAPLRLQLGATLYTPMLTVRNTQRGSPVLSSFLRAWSVLIMIGGVLGALGALGVSGWWLSGQLATPPSDLVQASQLAGSSLVVLAAPAGGICLAALLLIGLPLLLIGQGRLTAELASIPSWVPAARRYALRPALSILGFLTGGLLIAVYAAATAGGLGDRSHALVIVVPLFDMMITWRTVLLLLAAVLPYLLLIELPYRLGLQRWQQRWLQNLTSRRAELESHMRRLSAADPRSGEQNASEENLRAMQYDLVLLQFYRNKIEETERTPTAPFALRHVLALLAVGIVLAITVDNAGGIITLLTDNLDALTHLLGG